MVRQEDQEENVRKSQNSSMILRSKLDLEQSPTAEHEDTVRMTENSSITMSPSSSGSSGDHPDEEIFSESRRAPASETYYSVDASLKPRKGPQADKDHEDSGGSMHDSVTAGIEGGSGGIEGEAL
jgi:hypothetical protein